MAAIKSWTKEQEQYLVDNHKVKSIVEMKTILNKSIKAIRAKCRRLKLSCFEINNKKSLEEDTKFILNNKNMDFTTICATLNKGHRYIRNIMENNGLLVTFNKKGCKKWSYDEIEYLKNNYGKISRSIIADKLSRSIFAIMSAAAKHNLSHFESKYKIDKDTLIKLYIEESISVIDIAKQFTLTEDNIYTLLNHFDIKTNNKDKVIELTSGANNCNWKGHGSVPGKALSRVAHGAIRRGIKFDLSIEDLSDKFEKQNGKCFYTGLKLSFDNNAENKASVDRIDSSKGYTKENIQWVSKDVNFMKQALSHERFVSLCKLVSSNKELVI